MMSSLRPEMVRVALVLVSVLCAALSCESEDREVETTAAPVEKEAPAAPEASAAKDAPEVGGDAGGLAVKIEPPVGFDPLEACSGPFDPAQIPPAPVRGHFVEDEGVELSVPIQVVSGRLDFREDRILLSLDSEELQKCSPFKKDGGLAQKPRLAVRLSSLEAMKYRFPDPALDEKDKLFWYWNYVYSTSKGLPMTINAFSSEDTGEVIIEEVDLEKGVVAGKLLLCKDKGSKGWAVGRFEVPLCDKRPRAFKKKQAAQDADAGAAKGGSKEP